MAYYTQTGEPVFVTSAPAANQGAFYSAPVAAYPQMYSVPQQQPPAPCKYGASLSRVTSIWLGALLVFMGAVSLAGAGLAFRYYAYYSAIGTGLWCGAMFLSAGTVGIAAGKDATYSLIKGITISGALSVACGITQVTLAVRGLCFDVDIYSCYKFGCTDYQSCSCYWDDWQSYAIAANGMLAGAATLAIIFGFYLFVIGCRALCCFKNSPQMIPALVQLISNVPQHAPYEEITHQQRLSVSVQYAQHPQQLTASNHQPSVVDLHVTEANENHELLKYAEREHD